MNWTKIIYKIKDIFLLPTLPQWSTSFPSAMPGSLVHQTFGQLLLMRNKIFFIACCNLFFFLFFVTPAKSNIILPRFVSNGMILQRDALIPVWGWADAGEKIQLVFNGKAYNTVATKDRKWQLKLDATKAGGPYQIVLKGNNTITIDDVLIGDVWLCSGQSNMEYELYKAAEKYPKEIASSANDNIRHFQVKRNHSFMPLDNLESEKGWEKSSPNTVGNFSAIAYFFGRKLYEKYKVPIGLINSSYGGTPAEAWTSEAGLKNYPKYLNRALLFRDKKVMDSISESDKNALEEWNKNVGSSDLGEKEKWNDASYNFSDWATVSLPGFWQEKILPDVKAGTVWYKKDIVISKKYLNQPGVLRLGNIIMRDVTYINGMKIGTTSNKHAPRKYAIAKNILHEGINTITVKVTNEQGESGFIKDKKYQLEIGDTVIQLTGDWQYKLGVSVAPFLRDKLTKFYCEGTALYNAMIQPLVGFGFKGVIWYQGEANQSKAKEYRTLFPDLIQSWRAAWGQGNFPFLWVQLANINKPKPQPGESKLAELQDAQSHTLFLPNTGMAVIHDIGEWNDIHPMNKLDAANRLYLAALKVAYKESGIVFSGPTLVKTEISDTAIVLYFDNIGSGLVAKETGKLQYFAIAGENRKYVWADARIEVNKVIVSSKTIDHPKFVRYAWADNPIGANLYNKEGLPASCFNTENN